MAAPRSTFYRGVVGMFLIDDDAASPELPHTYGVDDIPLIAQDRRLPGGVLDPDESMAGTTGLLGDRILVNGTLGPYLDITTRRVRLRMLNGSNARAFRFHFADRRAFELVATDHGPLPAPHTTDQVQLAPGERAFFCRIPLEETAMARDDALKQLSPLARERAFERHVGSHRLIQSGLDALIAGVESPSLAMLAGLLRSEEPEAPALFDQVLEELGLAFHPPADPRAARWAMAYWIAGQIADGSLDPAAGTHLIHVEVAYELGRPKDLEPLVQCAHLLDAWDESWGVTFEQLNEEAVEAAKQFLKKRSAAEAGA